MAKQCNFNLSIDFTAEIERLVELCWSQLLKVVCQLRNEFYFGSTYRSLSISVETLDAINTGIGTWPCKAADKTNSVC